MRDGKLAKTASMMKSGSNKNRSGSGVKNVSSRRSAKGDQRGPNVRGALKGPTTRS